ncbi:hypothetical protein IAT38_006989 [Cryptococcus sp. DSM 104549]
MLRSSSASISPTKAGGPSHQHTHSHEVPEVDMETALLRSVIDIRPVGKHRHVLIMTLQNEVHQRTGIWVPVGTLWDRLGELYDLEALDEMASSSVSLPSSPHTLSPVLRPTPASARSSNSPLSDLSSPRKPKRRAPPPARGKDAKRGRSRSARVIDSKHFREAFELPYLRGGPKGKEGRWESDEGSEEEDEGAEGSEKEDGEGEGGEGGEMEVTSDNEVWEGMIYPKAKGVEGADEPWGGDDQVRGDGGEGEDDEGGEDAGEEEDENEDERKEDTPPEPTKRKRGRPPAHRDSPPPPGRRESGASTSAAAAAGSAPRKRGRPPKNAAKAEESEGSGEEGTGGKRTKGKERASEEVDSKRRKRR